MSSLQQQQQQQQQVATVLVARPHRYCFLANKVENVDRGHVWACPNMTIKSAPFRGGSKSHLIHDSLGLLESVLDRFIRCSTAHTHN